MMEPCHFIPDLIDQIRLINDTISNVVVYKKEIILLRTWLLKLSSLFETCTLIKKQRALFEETEALRSIETSLGLLANTIKMLTDGVWITIAFKWRAVQPTDDLLTITVTIKRACTELDINIETFEPTAADYTEDYHEIYHVLAPAQNSTPGIKDRLKSIVKFLEDHNLPKATVVQDSMIAEIFSHIKEYEVDRQEFQLKQQIGTGATGNVFKAIHLPTNKTVAIKQLNNLDLTDPEIESLRREIAILSSLRHPYLIEFVGATSTPPYWIITDFMDNGSLYSCLRNNRLNATELTKIAYESADGVAYLHSKNIIHRDLKTLNVLVSQDNEARVCDFGISRSADSQIMTGLVGTYNYMAPEVITRARYTLKADSFSFGMMLWEMLTGQVPFSYVSNSYQIGDLIVKGQRPEFPRNTPAQLKDLIQSCWAQNPDSRPTFEQIKSNFIRSRIAFPGADMNKLAAFYEQAQNTNYVDQTIKSTRHASLNNVNVDTRPKTPDDVIISLIETPENPTITDLIRTEVLSNKPEIVSSLQQKHFIEKVTPNLMKFKDIPIITAALIVVMDNEISVAEFINSGGVETIIAMLDDKNLKIAESGSRIIAHISPFISLTTAVELFNVTLDRKLYETSCIILDAKPEADFKDSLENHKYDLLSGLQMKFRGKLFNAYVSICGFSPELAKHINVDLVVSNSSVDFAENICRIDEFNQSIRQGDVIYLLKAFSEKKNSPDMRAAAAVVITVLPIKVIEILSERKSFIDDIFQLQNIETAGRLMFRLCQFSEAAKYILQNEDYLKKNINVPSILSLFIRIGAYFPSKVISDKYVIDRVLSLLKHKIPQLPEVCMRILGVLSSAPKFLPLCEEVSDMLFTLLQIGALSQLETTLAVGCLYNISEMSPFKKLAPQILSLAETNSDYAGLVFRIVSRCPLPRANIGISGRILDLVVHFIASDDKYGAIAACEILMKMAQNPDYTRAVEMSSVSSKLNMAMSKDCSIDLFVRLAEVSEKYKFNVTARALNNCDGMLTRVNVDYLLTRQLMEMRSGLRKRLIAE